MDTFELEKEGEEFICVKCHYKCCKKYNYDRHCLTDKHKMIHKGYILDTKNEQNEQNEQKQQVKSFVCECGNKYKYSQGLSKHKKTCDFFKSNENEPDKKDDLINYLIKENQEFKSLILEIVKKDNTINNNTISNSNINSHNKTFNLNFFLN